MVEAARLGMGMVEAARLGMGIVEASKGISSLSRTGMLLRPPTVVAPRPEPICYFVLISQGNITGLYYVPSQRCCYASVC